MGLVTVTLPWTFDITVYGSLTLWQQYDIIRMVLLISEVFCLSQVLSVSE